MAWASLEQVAHVLNLTPRWVNRLVKEQGMPRHSRGEYDLVACVHWYIAFLEKRIEDAQKGTEDEATARRRLISANARLRELQLAKARGEMVDSDSVMSLIDEMVTVTKAKLLTVPSKVAVQILACRTPGEVRDFLDKEIRDTLEELSHRRNIKPAGGFQPTILEQVGAATEAHGERVGRQQALHSRGRKPRRTGEVADVKS
jgi:phage terminase Nu1 subunit (DNA packaging protein)